MKLNLGSGVRELEGFLNLDKLLGWKFEEGLDFPDGGVEAITISHMVSQIRDEDWEICFKDVYRVLEIGGIVRVTDDDAENAEGEHYGGFRVDGVLHVVSLTSPAKLRNVLSTVGFFVVDVLPDETNFKDNSLIQRFHGDPPKVFHIEGIKRWTLDEMMREEGYEKN